MALAVVDPGLGRVLRERLARGPDVHRVGDRADVGPVARRRDAPYAGLRAVEGEQLLLARGQEQSGTVVGSVDRGALDEHEHIVGEELVLLRRRQLLR